MFKCYEDVEINALIGETMTAVTGGKGDEEMRFICKDGTKFIFYHSQDCCETVLIEDVVGDLEDLVGTPILTAKETSNRGDENDDNTSTWTFYEFGTIKGSVTVRWYGYSNGYYSESVDLRIERD